MDVLRASACDPSTCMCLPLLRCNPADPAGPQLAPTRCRPPPAGLYGVGVSLGQPATDGGFGCLPAQGGTADQADKGRVALVASGCMARLWPSSSVGARHLHAAALVFGAAERAARATPTPRIKSASLMACRQATRSDHAGGCACIAAGPAGQRGLLGVRTGLARTPQHLGLACALVTQQVANSQPLHGASKHHLGAGGRFDHSCAHHSRCSAAPPTTCCQRSAPPHTPTLSIPNLLHLYNNMSP